MTPITGSNCYAIRLRIPHSDQEVQGHQALYDPCYCLLEDDGDLIGSQTSETRPLLRKPVNPQRENEVLVLIRCTLRKPEAVMDFYTSALSAFPKVP